MVLLVDEDDETGSLFVVDDGVVVEEGVEVAESQCFLVIRLLGERHILLQNVVAALTVLIKMVEQYDLHSFLSAQKGSHILTDQFGTPKVELGRKWL